MLECRSERENNTLTFEIPVAQLLSKCGISSPFHLAPRFPSFLKQDKCFSKPAADLNLFSGMVSHKVIDVSDD